MSNKYIYNLTDEEIKELQTDLIESDKIMDELLDKDEVFQKLLKSTQKEIKKIRQNK